MLKGLEAEHELARHLNGDVTEVNCPFDVIVRRNKDSVLLVECKDRRESNQKCAKLNPKQKKRQDMMVKEYEQKYEYVDTALFVLTRDRWLWKRGYGSTCHFKQMFRAKFR